MTTKFFSTESPYDQIKANLKNKETIKKSKSDLRKTNLCIALFHVLLVMYNKAFMQILGLGMAVMCSIYLGTLIGAILIFTFHFFIVKYLWIPAMKTESNAKEIIESLNELHILRNELESAIK